MAQPIAKIGKYQVRREIGRGGSGRVYEAFDPVVNRRVAIKVLLSADADEDMLLRFRHEATATGRLQHKNIITIYDFGEHESSPYIVMEYLEGDDLQQIIKSERQLPLIEKVRIMTEIAEGLRYAHNKGVVHRDVKPGNIKVHPNGVVKIMDFGIALLLRERAARATQVGYLVGTLTHLAPESLFGKDPDYRSDIFSYGTIYYELVSGKNPFAAQEAARILYNITNSEPENLASLVPGCPQEIAALVGRALAKDPIERYQSMEDLLLDSAPILGELRRQEAAKLVEHAQSLFLADNFEQAISEVREALVLDPEQTNARSLRDSVQQRLAMQTVEERIRKLQQSAEAAIEINDFSLAEHQLENALKFDPSDQLTQDLQRRLQQLRHERTRAGDAVYEAPDGAPERVSLSPEPAYPVNDLTKVFSTGRGTATPAPTPAPAADPPASEFTRLFVVGRSDAESSSTTGTQALPPQDTILTISGCAKSENIGSHIGLRSFPFTIGRSDADWTFPFDSAISAQHAEIDYREGGFFIRDLGSSNGTLLNGQKLAAMRHEILLFGARILLGTNTEVVFSVERTEELPDLKGSLVGHRFRLAVRLHSTYKSVLYLAQDENLPRQVVVKLLSPSLIRHSGYREQFSREAQTASQLRHSHICQVLDSGEFQLESHAELRSLYVCMEYLPGGNLQQRLSKAEGIPLEQVVTWLERIGEALNFVHARGVVHAGIKPSAIVFDTEDRPYLTDFAFAVRTGEADQRIVVGSPAFLSPEQWEGAEPSPATDQYSLAVLFYWLLAGTPPFEGQEHSAVRKRNLLRGADPVHAVAAHNQRSAVPAAMSDVFKRALSVQPTDRFSGAAEFAAAIRSSLTAPTAPRAGPPFVFISYQRNLSSAWAILLKRELERDNAFKVFVDTHQEDSSGPFPLKLQRRIEECDVFVCILAESTLSSGWVRHEIRLASETNKPMIPVFQESYRNPSNLSAAEPHIQELLTYDGIKLLDRQNLYFDAAMQTLIASAHHLVRTGGSTTKGGVRQAGSRSGAVAELARSDGLLRKLMNKLSVLLRGNPRH